MEAPRFLRYTFSSSEGRRKIRERQRIVQEMVDTIINHNPLQESSPTTLPIADQAVYRGTLLGWVVLSALTKEQTFTSGTSNCYSEDAAIFTTSRDEANVYPHLWDSQPELYLKPALHKMKRREGLRVSRREQNELNRKLSSRVTIEAVIPKTDYLPYSPDVKHYLNVNQQVLRLKVTTLSQASGDQIKSHIGVNPAEVAQELAARK